MVTDGDRVTVHTPNSTVSPLAMRHNLTPFFLMNSVLHCPASLNFVYLAPPFDFETADDHEQRNVMPFMYICNDNGFRYGMPFENTDLLRTLPLLFQERSVNDILQSQLKQMYPMMSHDSCLNDWWRKHRMAMIANGVPVSLNDCIDQREKLRYDAVSKCAQMVTCWSQ